MVQTKIFRGITGIVILQFIFLVPFALIELHVNIDNFKPLLISFIFFNSLLIFLPFIFLYKEHNLNKLLKSILRRPRGNNFPGLGTKVFFPLLCGALLVFNIYATDIPHKGIYSWFIFTLLLILIVFLFAKTHVSSYYSGSVSVVDRFFGKCSIIFLFTLASFFSLNYITSGIEDLSQGIQKYSGPCQVYHGARPGIRSTRVYIFEKSDTLALDINYEKYSLLSGLIFRHQGFKPCVADFDIYYLKFLRAVVGVD